MDTSTLHFDYSFFIRVEDKSSLYFLITSFNHFLPNYIFTSRYDNDRTKAVNKFVGKHVLFDMTFYRPFPLLGIVVWEHGAAEICVDVTGNVEKTYEWLD